MSGPLTDIFLVGHPPIYCEPRIYLYYTTYLDADTQREGQRHHNDEDRDDHETNLTAGGRPFYNRHQSSLTSGTDLADICGRLLGDVVEFKTIFYQQHIVCQNHSDYAAFLNAIAHKLNSI